MRVLFFSLSKTGGRNINEDSISCETSQKSYLFAVADGLGGHGKGEYASKLAIDRSVEVFRGKDKGREETLRDCFEESQKLLIDSQAKNNNHQEMKTTLVLLYLDDQAAVWGHIGDTRLYFFDKNNLIQRTADHSVPQMLASLGKIEEKDIRHHEDRNRLLRVLGADWGQSKYDIWNLGRAPQYGDTFLLCSDGFWEWVDEKCMVKLLKKSLTPDKWILSMEKELIRKGSGSSMDNYSAIAVFVR
jgi:PPM family protein phosphatase